MRRPYTIALIVLGIAFFLVLSALLARAFSVSGAEDAAITALVRAEAQGDRQGVIALISDCRASPACLARASTVSTALRRPGSVSIIQILHSSSFSLGATLGTARVAWLAGDSLPRVQCVRVRHSGNVLAGFRVQLLEVSPRIRTNGDCPKRF